MSGYARVIVAVLGGFAILASFYEPPIGVTRMTLVATCFGGSGIIAALLAQKK